MSKNSKPSLPTRTSERSRTESRKLVEYKETEALLSPLVSPSSCSSSIPPPPTKGRGRPKLRACTRCKEKVNNDSSSSLCMNCQEEEEHDAPPASISKIRTSHAACNNKNCKDTNCVSNTAATPTQPIGDNKPTCSACEAKAELICNECNKTGEYYCFVCFEVIHKLHRFKSHTDVQLLEPDSPVRENQESDQEVPPAAGKRVSTEPSSQLSKKRKTNDTQTAQEQADDKGQEKTKKLTWEEDDDLAFLKALYKVGFARWDMVLKEMHMRHRMTQLQLDHSKSKTHAVKLRTKWKDLRTKGRYLSDFVPAKAPVRKGKSKEDISKHEDAMREYALEQDRRRLLHQQCHDIIKDLMEREKCLNTSKPVTEEQQLRYKISSGKEYRKGVRDHRLKEYELAAKREESYRSAIVRNLDVVAQLLQVQINKTRKLRLLQLDYYNLGAQGLAKKYNLNYVPRNFADDDVEIAIVRDEPRDGSESDADDEGDSQKEEEVDDGDEHQDEEEEDLVSTP